ncbi:hypothetical protein X772_28230 [Mesorhizobium sp. LSJC280B00]|nr:hypothetical protein X772_28230 [Mesorhizobium sp. LSJC280B00]
MGHCRRSNNDGVGLQGAGNHIFRLRLLERQERRNGEVSRAESLTYAAEIAASTDIPVTADLEKDTPIPRRGCRFVGQGAPGLTFDQIAEAGVLRISVGGSLARAIAGALLKTGQEIAAGDFTRIGNHSDLELSP